MLISQVELWSISSRVYDVFGADIERSVASHMSTELDRLQSMYERWYQKWQSALSLKGDVNNFSLWIFDLYFHSAKLFLFSHAFRGPLQDGINISSEFTTYALGSALSTIRCLVEAKEPSSWLRALPAHFGIMAAFASVSLIRTTFQQQTNYSLETAEILRNLQRLVEVLETSFSAEDHPPHVWASIARSLKAAMETQQHAAPEEGHHINESPCYTSLNFDLFMNDTLDLDLFGSASDWILPAEATGL
ncbi:hypothetical protein MGYG_03857 [Paecilomyces variotii No. 5]|uniref:Transcription factor domain-containing protein n=1 Tax=Byssochlamys spectabilis (strain No. 5 / NBRC 109023) TaxID=1356009 RepID=V5FYQ2_BYSSN|nr:hypothetical protein MGYG_03857 [Paecilomyces variotii No. 5]